MDTVSEPQPMNQDAPESRLPRRCGNCRNAVRSTALDGSVIACIVLLEYHCADRIACPQLAVMLNLIHLTSVGSIFTACPVLFRSS